MNKRKKNYFTHNYTLSNKKKKEEMDKVVKLVHKFMVYDIVKKFMNYDFMGDNPKIEELTCPNCPIERDPYYLTDDIDNYIVKEYATDDVVAIIKRSKLRDWEAFHTASDVVNYLNLSEEEKNKPLKDW